MTPQDNTEKLSEALKNNECARVEELIANGAGVDQSDAKGTRPLQHAAKTGCTLCLTLLLSHGAGIRATATMNALSAVSIAASNSHIDTLQCLLNNCTDVSVINDKKEKEHPLHYACSNGTVDAVRCIIEKYPHAAYLRACKNAKQCTSLHIAAENGNFECTEVLLEHSSEIKTTDIDGATVLFYAARHEKLVAAQFLHDRGVSALMNNRKGWLPLHNACFNEHVNVARFLLEQYSGTVNAMTSEENDCWATLHMAAASGSVDCIKLLLRYEASIEAMTNDGKTPLHVADVNRQLLAVKCLLENGAQETVVGDKNW